MYSGYGYKANRWPAHFLQAYVILAAHSRRRVRRVRRERSGVSQIASGRPSGPHPTVFANGPAKGGEGGKGGESARNHRLRRLFRLPSARMRKLSLRFESDEFGRQGDGGEKRRFSPGIAPVDY